MKEVTTLGPLRDPVLIAGFVVHRQAGRIGSRAVSYLVGQWNGELVTRMESEDFMDFTTDRPETQSVGDARTIKWPDTLVYRARLEGASRDFLLLVGFEPHLRWNGFVQDLAAYCDAAGVKTLVSIRGFPATVPHTRPTPVQVTSSDPELGARFGDQASRSAYEGPVDILGVLAAAGQEKGWQTVDLSVLQPSYYPRMRNAAATMAVVAVLDQAFGTSTATESLAVAAREQSATLDQNAPPEDEFRSMLTELERLYDEAKDKSEFLSTSTGSELPSGQEAVDEIERLLRRHGGTDPPADDGPEP
jgi:predicted ATP-grasp superfamily ATP-dependent carboligase